MARAPSLVCLFIVLNPELESSSEFSDSELVQRFFKSFFRFAKMSEQDLADLFATSLQQALEPIAQRLSFLEQAAAQPSSSVSNCDEEDPRSGITNSLPQVDKDSADARGTILDTVRVVELPSSVVVDVEDKTPDQTNRPTVNMVNSLAETRSTGVEARRFQVSSEVASCLERALRHTLTRSERAERVLKFPRPDTPAAMTPKLDRSLTDAFGLGRYTREPWFSVQDQLLDSLGPLVALWEALVSKPSSMTATEMESCIRTSITLNNRVLRFPAIVFVEHDVSKHVLYLDSIFSKQFSHDT